MTAITYLAVRSLVSGHTVGLEYGIDQPMLDSGLVPTREVKLTRVEAIDGVHREILRYYGRMTYACKTAPLNATQLAQMREFLDSCEENTFTFDPYGSVAVPDAPFLATLGSDGYTIERTLQMAAGGKTDLYSLAFTVVPAQ